MNLTPSTVGLVARALQAALTPHVPAGLVGVSCLAAGADTIFARTVVDLGGDLEVILPADDYRRQKVEPEHADEFDALIRRARRVRIMPYPVSGRGAYQAANEALLTASDRLLAVWDGGSPLDVGGTAAVVTDARRRGLPVEIIWPPGARRS